MPDAKVLRFPGRSASVACSREDVSTRAECYLSVPLAERSTEFVSRTLTDGDVFTAVIASLWKRSDSDPPSVLREAVSLHTWLAAHDSSEFFFDERDYFLGECALLAAGATRLLGERGDCERWLDRADASYRHTVAPAPHLGRVAYSRLALRFDSQRYEEVRELISSVALTFRKIGMSVDLAKCLDLEASNLKEMGRKDEAFDKLQQLVNSESNVPDLLRGMAFIGLGEILSGRRNFEEAMGAYRGALAIFEAGEQHYALADLKLLVASTLREMGLVESALVSYAEAAEGHARLGMVTRAAYVRVLFADALLEAGKAREAEWQILAALPALDEQEMVPEGFAAVALLRESVRQRKMDPKAFLEVRDYLRSKN